MTVVQGAAVGGGSLIYANVSVEAQPFVFDKGWPAEISYAALQPHYAAAGRMLNVQDLPDNQLTERFKLMHESAEALGHGARFGKLPLAVTFDPEWHYGLDDPPAEIGRASCREKVCQTVYISGVAVSLKKKISKKAT